MELEGQREALWQRETRFGVEFGGQLRWSYPSLPPTPSFSVPGPPNFSNPLSTQAGPQLYWGWRRRAQAPGLVLA